MEKTSQKRSVLNRIREMTNVSGIAAEKYFNPQFEEVMNNLRSVDANIRSIAAGKSLDNGDPGSDPVALKDLLKSAKSNLNRREFMTSVADLGRFHKKVAEIVSELTTLQNKVDEVHHQFLFQDLGDEHVKELQNLKSRWASEEKRRIVKEASIMDFFHNILSDRGRALSFYEKRYDKQVKPLRSATVNILLQSEKVLNNILSVLKEMATARATRSPDKYISAAGKIEKVYRNYDQSFKAYYSDKIKPFEKFFTQEQSKQVDNGGVGGQDIPVAPREVPELNFQTPKQNPQTLNQPQDTLSKLDEKYGPVDLVNPNIPKDPKIPSGTGQTIPGVRQILPPHDTVPSPKPNMDPDEPLTLRSPKKDGEIKANSHENFYNSLQSMANEDPIIVASFIRKYAESIQNSDIETAIKLMKTVRSIRG